MEQSAELNFLMQVRMNNVEGVKDLVKANPKIINACDEYESNALIYALKDKNVELAKFLLAKGIDVVQVDRFNNNPYNLACAIGDKELISMVELTSVKIYQKNVALMRKRGNNPFHAYDINNFVCWEITADYSPFSSLDATGTINGDIRTFIGIGAIHIERVQHVNRGGAMAMSMNKPQVVGQTIFIDYVVDEPKFQGDIVGQKNLWRKNLELDPVIKKRKEELEQYGIRHIIDYDMRGIVYAVNSIINN